MFSQGVLGIKSFHIGSQTPPAECSEYFRIHRTGKMMSFWDVSPNHKHPSDGLLSVSHVPVQATKVSEGLQLVHWHMASEREQGSFLFFINTWGSKFNDGFFHACFLSAEPAPLLSHLPHLLAQCVPRTPAFSFLYSCLRCSMTPTPNHASLFSRSHGPLPGSLTSTHLLFIIHHCQLILIDFWAGLTSWFL